MAKKPKAPKLKKDSEAELASWTMQHLTDEGWDCYPEVSIGDYLSRSETRKLNGSFGGKVADIVAVKGTLVMIVECKLSYSLSLLEQAIEWTRLAPLVAVAVPFRAIGNRKMLRHHLSSHFGVGTFGVSSSHLVNHGQPKLFRGNMKWVETMKAMLSDVNKLSTPGSSSTFRRTPYQDTMIELRCILAEKSDQKMVLKDLFEALGGCGHYSSLTSMKSSIRTLLVDGDEPDLVMGAGGVVTWEPERCTKGEKYVAHIKAVAARRKSMSKPKRARAPKLKLAA